MAKCYCSECGRYMGEDYRECEIWLNDMCEYCRRKREGNLKQESEK